EVAGRVGLGEALVVVHVAVHDDVRAGCVQVVPERQRRGPGGKGTRGGRVEARVVPHREDALAAGGGEVGLEPQLLGGSGGRRNEAVVAVHHDDVPGAHVEAVVACAPGPGGGAEVVPRGVGIPQPVIVIADRGIGAIQLPAPGGRVQVR